MTTPPPKDIVIVGGSLGGLFTAIVLHSLLPSSSITILERTPTASLRDQGAGISAIPVIPPVLALCKNALSPSPLLDFIAEFDPEKRQQILAMVGENRQMQFLNKAGAVQTELPISNPEITGASSWEVLYRTLRDIFDGNENEKKGRYLDGVKVISVEEVDEEVHVKYESVDGEIHDLKADLVVGADGASSVVKKSFSKSERSYSGYVAWRGTVIENEVEPESRELLKETLTTFFSKGCQILIYTIPGPDGDLRPGHRNFNIVWYDNVTPEDLSHILTDAEGNTHRFSLGIGKISPSVKANQQEKADQVLPPNLAKLWKQVDRPFIQAITDSVVDQMVFCHGKVILLGDAVAGLRPHTTAGTTQAALHALLLKKVFGSSVEGGNLSLEKWGEECLALSTAVQKIGVGMGNLSQFGDHPMAAK